jgi:hypothetical protein
LSGARAAVRVHFGNCRLPAAARWNSLSLQGLFTLRISRRCNIYSVNRRYGRFDPMPTIPGLRQVIAAAAVLLFCAAAVGAPPTAGPDAAAAEKVVREFNAAISTRRLDAALALVAKGSVNFSLQPAHGFTAGADAAGASALTTDLATHWRTIAPILFGTAKAFRREVGKTLVRVDGDLGMVWADVVTVTEPRSGPVVRVAFAETYLLQRREGAWTIAAIASSRPTR